MRWIAIVLVGMHGMLHFIGPAKTFGWAHVPGLSEPISKTAALGWAAAGMLLLLTALLWSLRVPGWWWLALVAAVASQALIISAWTDARFGTPVNALLLLAAIHGLASGGRLSLRAEYLEQARARIAQHATQPLLTEDALEGLPALVASYIRRSGAVGRPRVAHFSVHWKGRIRRQPGEPWMTFTAAQVNTVEPPTRFFFMDAKRGGLPVDVLHAFHDGEASMRVRLLSLLPLVDARGPELTRAETVTLFNDLVLFAPGALVSDRIAWQALDDHAVLGRYTLGANTVEARLVFDDHGELVDFISDDRLAASADGKSFEPMRWSTPVSDFVQRDGLRVPRDGQARWHPADGEDYVYIEGTFTAHEVNGPAP